jgi:WD40 repeat protein
MGDSKYTELSLPLRSESGFKSSRGKRTTAKLIAGISGLAIFGYFMSATYFSTPESSALNLNAYGAGLIELVDQYQLDLVSDPVKVSEFGKARDNWRIDLALSKDNSLAAFINLQDEIEVWNVEKKELLSKFIHSDNENEPVIEISLTPDGKYLISVADNNNFLKIWDLGTKALYGQIEVSRPHNSFVTSDSKYVASEYHRGVLFWDITSLKKSRSLKIRDDEDLRTIAFTRDSKYLAMMIKSYSDDTSRLRVYDVNARRKIADLKTEIDAFQLKISDNGKTVAGAEIISNNVHVWNVETGNIITIIELEEDIVDFRLSPDGRFIYSSSFSQSKVYDLKASKIIKEFNWFLYKATFTKDSKYLLIISSYYINVNEIETFNQVASLEHKSYINEVYLSDDGEYLLVSTQESVYLWSLKNLKD